ncbi:MAG: ABC transporter ATP-binding protein [Lachnospiraceae bacterium]
MHNSKKQDILVSFEHYSFQYRSQSEPTLHDINLQIRCGERVVIVGASGCGKSTLAHCLNGLIPFCYQGESTGVLMVNGVEAKETSVFELSQSVGTVLQDTDGQFIGMTVLEDIAFSLENICVPQDELKKRTLEEAVKVNLLDKLTAAPHELSGGQKQRVSMAGVLINRIPILLFDEPLANLDPAAGKDAIELIDQIQQETDTTVLIIEHRLEDALHMGADRIILMEDGRIVSDTSPSILFAGNQLIEAGIREPLYITALKYAKVALDGSMPLARIQELVLTPMQINQVREWFLQEETVPPEESQQPILAVEELSFGYTPYKQNLTQVGFTIHRGEMVSIVGKNGAGKSTLAKLLCGFEKSEEGSIYVKGKDVATDTIKERAQYIGYVMQNPNQMISKPFLFDEVAISLQVRHMDPTVIEDKVWHVLKKCGLYQFRKWPIQALSYGQKKRVTIASILVQEPEILILDEPTAGQDFRHYTEFMEFLQELNQQGITVLMITHDMHLMLEYTSRTLVFSEGRMIADTTPAQLFSDKTLIQRASLKETSLFALAQMCQIDPEAFIHKFIRYDRQVRQ